MKNKDYVQGALFEKDFLVRTLGNLANQPDIALTELIANAWDAGATEVEIFIPEKHGELLTIKDNGTGLTQEEFKSRWMKLGYNRLENQGKKVVFPNGVDFKRYAYGRNGVGRHGLLCFNDEYTVITSKNAIQSTFQITTQSEKEPFVIKEESRKKATSQGTTLEVVVTKNLPKSSEINDIISARFLHDPNFKITINRNIINLATHAGLIKTIDFPFEDYSFKIHLIDTKKSRKNTLYQGVAIWQSGRLIGEPSWALGANIILDGRTQEAKKYSIVIETNDLEQYIREGGVIRNEKVVNFQLWNADDYEHRLKPAKLLYIISLSEDKLGIDDSEIEVEYQNDTIGKYNLDFNGKTFILKNKTTDCLAQDACGIPLEKEKKNLAELTSKQTSCCTPDSGCC